MLCVCLLAALGVGPRARAEDEASTSEPPPSESSAASFSTRGTAGLRYVFRGSRGRDEQLAEDDHDLYLDLAGEAKYGIVRGVVSARIDQDLDGRGPSLYDSLDEIWDDSTHGYLYEAYLELSGLGPVASLRAGRQYVGEGLELRFDGARATTDWLGDGLIRLDVFGGKPARLYDSSSRGDWLVGAAIELRPLPGLEARLDYTHVTDRRDPPGIRATSSRRIYRDDDLVRLTLRYRLTQTLRLLARASTFALRSSRLEGEALYHDPDMDLLLRARYILQLGSYRDLSVDFSPLDEVIGEYEPYHELLGEAAKGFGDWIRVGGGVAARILTGGAEEGPFNHEFLRFFGRVEVWDVPWEGLSLSVLAEHYRSDEGPDRTVVVSADVSQELPAGLTASIGTAYSYYKFDEFFLVERDDVQSVYARLEWRPIDPLRVSASYEVEVDDEDLYHTVRVGVRYAW